MTEIVGKKISELTQAASLSGTEGIPAVNSSGNTIRVLAEDIAKLAPRQEFTAADIGLGNVNNTSDADKPLSIAALAALEDKAELNHQHVSTDITDFTAAVTAIAGTGATVTFVDGEW